MRRVEGFSRQPLRLHGRALATEPSAVPQSGSGFAPRTIAISAKGASGDIRFLLSAGDAAELMFQIGYALEQAAVSERGSVPASCTAPG